MKTCDCSVCGRSVNAHVWGFALLARDGWEIAPSTNPPGAAERSWLCHTCDRYASLARTAIQKQVGLKPALERGRKGGALRVLIVDDHVLLLRCIARLLKDCQTVLSTSPRAALAMLLAGGEFDVIVCDVMMPEVTGPELYARCFSHSPELGRRFLFASSDPLTARRLIDEAARRVGAVQAPALLKKPISQTALMAAVSAVAAEATHASGTYLLHLPEGDAPAPSAKRPRRSSTGFR